MSIRISKVSISIVKNQGPLPLLKAVKSLFNYDQIFIFRRNATKGCVGKIKETFQWNNFTFVCKRLSKLHIGKQIIIFSKSYTLQGCHCYKMTSGHFWKLAPCLKIAVNYYFIDNRSSNSFQTHNSSKFSNNFDIFILYWTIMACLHHVPNELYYHYKRPQVHLISSCTCPLLMIHPNGFWWYSERL